MNTQPFERWRGALVMRTPEEHRQRRIYLERCAMLGRQVRGTTRRGTRHHICTVVAVYNPEAHRRRLSSRTWVSALERVRYENAPRSHCSGYGAVILRIDASTSPNMVNRYLCVGDFLP